MSQMLFFFIGRTLFLDILVWVLLIGTLLLLAVLLYMQYKQSKVLKFELSQLDKVKSHNVEYDFILKAMRLAVWHLDAKNRTMTFEKDYRVNSAGFTPPPDTSFDELVMHYHEDDRQRMSEAMTDICEGTKDSLHEVFRGLSWFSDDTFWSETFAMVAERDAEGKPLKVVGASMRIDQRKEMEEELVKARARAEESDRLKTAFLANISHEIRTPLNAIVGFTSVLPDVAEEAERKELLNLIHQNTQKLLRIVDDVVNISKIEAGMEQLVMTAFDLNLFLTQMAQTAKKDAQQGVEVTTEFAADEQFITTDHSRLTEILRHLLSNATKFTSQGCIVVGYSAPRNGRLRIWVRDTGKGIPEEYQKRIFERFFKVDEFVPGAGLGLSVCQAMAYSLGGKVGVESKPDEGSTFWVEVPFQ